MNVKIVRRGLAVPMKSIGHGNHSVRDSMAIFKATHHCRSILSLCLREFVARRPTSKDFTKQPSQILQNVDHDMKQTLPS